MDVGLGLTGIKISGWVWAGLGLAGVGLFLAFTVLSNARIQIIKTGEEPDAVYRRWKNKSWVKRLDRRKLFIASFAVGMLLAGVAVVLFGLS